MDDHETVPTLEAAELLGVDVADVYRMIENHRLNASWNGRRLVVPGAEVEALINSGR